MSKKADLIVQTEYNFDEDIESIKTAALVVIARSLKNIDRTLVDISRTLVSTRYRTEEKAKLARKIVRLQNELKKVK